MRPDMAKIIVERPRGGRGLKYPRAAARPLALNNYEDAPTHEPVKSRHFKHRKWLNENLAPLRRFLRSNLGRPWNDVKAEIAAHVGKDTAIQFHVWQHIEMDVAEHVTRIDGELYTFRYTFVPLAYYHRGFYVAPDTGLLLESRPPSKRERQLRAIIRKKLPLIFRIDETREYHCVNNIWYEIHYAFEHIDTPPVWDVLQKAELIPPQHYPKGPRRYACFKRQLNKRQIKHEIDPRLRHAAEEIRCSKIELEQLHRARRTQPGSSLFAR